MHRPPSFLPLAWAGLLACLALPVSAQVQTFSAPLTTAHGTTIGTVLCETNPSIDVQGSCTATATAAGWCMVNALVDPGLPVGRSAQPGAGGTPTPATCVASLGVGFTLPVVCTGQAYRFTVQVTAQSPGGGGGGQPPKDHEKEHDDKAHGKDRDGNHERDKDRDKDDRAGDGSSSRVGTGGGTRTAGAPSGRTDDRQAREGGGRNDDDRKEGKGKDGEKKEKDRDEREHKDHGTKPQTGGGPAVVFSVTVPYACPIPL